MVVVGLLTVAGSDVELVDDVEVVEVEEDEDIRKKLNKIILQNLYLKL